MKTVRITHRAGLDLGNISIELTGDGAVRQEVSLPFNFALKSEESELLSWYLESYLEHPHAPGPERARRAEEMLSDVGIRLFEAVFERDRDARRLWSQVEPHLEETRFEVVGASEGGWRLPWEVMREPSTQEPLCLRASEFVRTHPSPTRLVRLPMTGELPVRILLIICRPGREADVPFQSIARRIVAALGTRAEFSLDVLRPPTYEALEYRLREAQAQGKPYHVVHFDGHGTFLDLHSLLNATSTTAPEDTAHLASLLHLKPHRFAPQQLYPRQPRQGERGYLLFENPNSHINTRFVDGLELGSLLAQYGVSLLSLNACRSALAADPQGSASDEGNEARHEVDRHEQVRAFGSLAQEIMDAGLAGVLAMSYNVYVATATQFVEEFYRAVARGETFGKAASSARRQLATQPLRSIVFDPLPLQDWMVPIVYEAAPVSLVASANTAVAPPSVMSQRALDVTMKMRDLVAPDHGFFGRDETLLNLDRAFDQHGVVLLHAFAGSGKTTVAGEFARWYVFTGGLNGPVMRSTFGQRLTLAWLLEGIEATFRAQLEAASVQWATLSHEERREWALRLLRQQPVFWIWEEVEQIAGFPTGTASSWSEEEQRKLSDFLRDAQSTGSKFLLLSRHDERTWLSDLPRRLTMPPMPLSERMQLARSLAEKQGRHLEIRDWLPLLFYTQGNPLTLVVAIKQAFSEGCQNREDVAAFVERLRAGELPFDDDERQGRSRSLSASLSYGFEQAFNESERQVLALLHLFQGFVSSDVLWDVSLADILSPGECFNFSKPQIIGMLHTAADVGLLRVLHTSNTPESEPSYFEIHPALPWFLKGLFDKFYPVEEDDDQSGELKGRRRWATRLSFCHSIALFGSEMARAIGIGHNHVTHTLAAEEANLLRAHQMCLENRWTNHLTGIMSGLQVLYAITGRRSQWKRLVDEILPLFLDLQTEEPLPGQEDEWEMVIGFRVQVAQQGWQPAEAERLLLLMTGVTRERVAPLLQISIDQLHPNQYNAIRSLAVTLENLGIAQREQDNPNCLTPFLEAYSLCHHLRNRTMGAGVCFNIAQVYHSKLPVHNLDEAEKWLNRALELTDVNDLHNYARTLNELGIIALEKSWKSLDFSRDDGGDEANRLLNEAGNFALDALERLPAHALHDRAVSNATLGGVEAQTGNIPEAVRYFNEAIRLYEEVEAFDDANGVRSNAAVALAIRGRFVEAMEFAQASHREFTRLEVLPADVERVERLIEFIEEMRREHAGKQPVKT